MLIPLSVLGFAVLLVVQLVTMSRADSPAAQPAAKPTPALTNVYRAPGSGQPLQYTDHNPETHDERIVVRVDAYGHNASGTGSGEGGCATINNYDGGRIYFDDGTTLDLTNMMLEGWTGQPPAFVSGTPAKRE